MTEPTSESGAFQPPTNSIPAGGPRSLDLRSTIRYSLRARVVFTWSDSVGVGHESEGFTRNMSRRGVFIVGAASPATGDRVTLAIFLPALASETRGLRIDAAGRVLRVEPASAPGSANGFAVSHESINLCAG